LLVPNVWYPEQPRFDVTYGKEIKKAGGGEAVREGGEVRLWEVAPRMGILQVAGAHCTFGERSNWGRTFIHQPSKAMNGRHRTRYIRAFASLHISCTLQAPARLVYGWYPRSFLTKGEFLTEFSKI
jgi:hypothetical protein